MSISQFWDHQSDDVRAVLDLAYLRDEATPEVHDRILAAFAPEHAAAIVQISDDIAWAERLRTDSPVAVLSDLLDAAVLSSFDALNEADRLAEEKESDAITAARFIASLLRAEHGPLLAVAR